MKKLVLTTLLCLTTVSAAIAMEYSIPLGKKTTDYHTIKDESVQVVSIIDASNDLLKEFENGSAPNIILECTQGALLPLEIVLSGSIVSIEGQINSPLKIKVDRTFYVQRNKKQLLFSLDGVCWKPFTEIFMGQLSFMLEARDDQRIFTAGVELNQRD